MQTSHLIQLRFFSRENQKIVALPKKWISTNDLPQDKRTKITFGHRSTRAKIALHRGPENEIWLTNDLADELLIPYPDKLWIKGDLENLSLGPVVGILTSDIHIRQLERPSNPRTKYFKTFLKAQHTSNRGACYFIFNLNSVDWQSLTLDGVFWRPDSSGGHWETRKVPFPDVLYNKIANRTEEKKPETQRFLQLLPVKTNSLLFNEGYFQKWDIYQRLCKVEDVQDFIPDTIFNPNANSIQGLLNKYGMVYLKPVNGFLGLGIYQLFPAKDSRIIARFRVGKQNIARRYASVKAFLKQEFSVQKLQRYVAQQGIRLIKINESQTDFRVHLNKNVQGNWEVTGIGAKIAGKGSVTTHVRAGGKILPPEQVLSSVFEKNSKQLQQQLEEICIRIGEALEATSAGPLGELGLDVGIDENGKIWMFEANAIPGRSIFAIPSLKPKDLYSAGLILDYSTHLTKFV